MKSIIKNLVKIFRYNAMRFAARKKISFPARAQFPFQGNCARAGKERENIIKIIANKKAQNVFFLGGAKFCGKRGKSFQEIGAVFLLDIHRRKT